MARRLTVLVIAALLMQGAAAGACEAGFELRAWAGPQGGAAEDIAHYRTDPVLTARDVAAAERVAGADGSPAVLVRLNGPAAARFAVATGAAIGQPMAILLDGEIVSAPVVRERIAGGQLMITGGFSNERAEALKAAFDRCSEGQE